MRLRRGVFLHQEFNKPPISKSLSEITQNLEFMGFRLVKNIFSKATVKPIDSQEVVNTNCLALKMSAKNQQRRFVSVDPSKCTGCGLCELACSQEKNERNPLHSRIRVVSIMPMFNFAISCRMCKDPKCVPACAETAIKLDEKTGLLIIDNTKCKGCDWCVQACDYGGISIQSDTGLATVCDLCGGTPQCIEFCPEEALELVDSDETTKKCFDCALENLSQQCKQLAISAKNMDWKTLIAATEKIDKRFSEKLIALNEKASEEGKIT